MSKGGVNAPFFLNKLLDTLKKIYNLFLLIFQSEQCHH